MSIRDFLTRQHVRPMPATITPAITTSDISKHDVIGQ